jgi:Glycerophosphoryl diester phosphodiesterase family
MIRALLLIFCSSFLLPPVMGQPFPEAHAHNDYLHEHPLLDALANGFTSVEADVHLIHGEFVVAHTRPLGNKKTLERLYLLPLTSILSQYDRHVFPGYEGPFYLMIDIKTDGDEAYDKLKNLFSQYLMLIPRPGYPQVIVLLSGNRPVKKVMEDPTSPFALDGRPADLGKGYTVQKMPVISDTYKKWSEWNGKGNPKKADLEKIRRLAQQVHREGKRLRLWAIPDKENTWRALLDAGVDIINTDNLQGLSKLLKARKSHYGIN